ncbi:MAG TPA: hypothetical protein VM582_07450 [Candidatus Thermoplasmatota archaeon]|nr:hypothetical protein [Candidatus Thermoplasmatota archaeon]
MRTPRLAALLAALVIAAPVAAALPWSGEPLPVDPGDATIIGGGRRAHVDHTVTLPPCELPNDPCVLPGGSVRVYASASTAVLPHNGTWNVLSASGGATVLVGRTGVDTGTVGIVVSPPPPPGPGPCGTGCILPDAVRYLHAFGDWGVQTARSTMATACAAGGPVVERTCSVIDQVPVGASGLELLP